MSTATKLAPKAKAKQTVKTETAKKNTKVLYMAVQPNTKVVREFNQLPIFWNGKAAGEIAKKLGGKKVRVTLTW